MPDRNKIYEKNYDFDKDDYPPYPGKNRFEQRNNFSYLKLFIVLVLAGFTVFAGIKLYNRYEEKKEIEATIEAIKKVDQEIGHEIEKVITPTQVAPVDSKQNESSKLRKTDVPPGQTKRVQSSRKEEIYKDKDGFWRNRPADSINNSGPTQDNETAKKNDNDWRSYAGKSPSLSGGQRVHPEMAQYYASVRDKIKDKWNQPNAKEFPDTYLVIFRVTLMPD